MIRTRDEWLEILRSDPWFEQFLQESSVLKMGFVSTPGKGRNRGRTMSASGKATKVFLSRSATRARMYWYLDRQYGLNTSSTQQKSPFVDAVQLWLAERWKAKDNA